MVDLPLEFGDDNPFEIPTTAPPIVVAAEVMIAACDALVGFARALLAVDPLDVSVLERERLARAAADVERALDHFA